MNGKEVSRQTSAKQTNTQTKHNRTKRLMVESAQTLAAEAAEGS